MSTPLVPTAPTPLPPTPLRAQDPGTGVGVQLVPRKEGRGRSGAGGGIAGRRNAGEGEGDSLSRYCRRSATASRSFSSKRGSYEADDLPTPARRGEEGTWESVSSGGPLRRMGRGSLHEKGD